MGVALKARLPLVLRILSQNVDHVCEVLLAGDLVCVENFVTGVFVVHELYLRYVLRNLIIAKRVDQVIISCSHNGDGNADAACMA